MPPLPPVRPPSSAAKNANRPLSGKRRKDPREDKIETAVNGIRCALAEFYKRVSHNRRAPAQMARVLRANVGAGKKAEVYEQAARTGGLILFGAMLFHLALAKKHPKVRRPEKAVRLANEWRFILEELNCAAIFGVARRLAVECEIGENALEIMLDAAKKTARTAADGVDLMGRIYHTLLADAKPLGAFYTSLPAATLMAGLALAPEDWGEDKEWADMDFIGKFRVADPACGSGTLLAAACRQMRENFSRADARMNKTGGKKSKTHPPDKVQKTLLEESVWGYDILETAAHLTATTLGLTAPGADFRKAHIYRTAVGETAGGAAAGSLELLEGAPPIFKRDEHVDTPQTPEPLPELDLCIMNPPFVRGTADNLSYGFLKEKERRQVQKRMNMLAKKHGYSNDKGLGPAFIALACRNYGKTSVIKDGGRLAAILPATLAAGMGGAWKNTRKKIEKDFDLETLVVSRDAARPNFSENTSLQECMIIARKRKRGENENSANRKRATPEKDTFIAVLRKNPESIEQALAAVPAIKTAQKSKSKTGDLRAGGKRAPSTGGVIGQFAKIPCRGKSAWHGISFSDIHLAYAAEQFSQTGTPAPYATGNADLIPLGDAADIGGQALHLQLNHEDFLSLKIARGKTRYAAYYPSYHGKKTGKPNRKIGTVKEDPHLYVLPLPGKEQWIKNYYKKAGRLVFNQSFRFNTTRRLAALVSRPVQASHYLPIKLRKESGQKLKALALWLNGTPALLLIANAAQSTDGSKVNFSQKAAMELPVLDLEKLSAADLRKLEKLFDKTAAGEGFLPIPQMEKDPVRIAIDNAFSEICGFGDLAPLRAALAAEPIITNKPADVSAD